ncbi:GNAT family N-acetyltransferase [Brachyspira aalborgi]|uniref:GNAT family N-acetyltransferase n=1 Tax=Brachyspira aalborgi TaxID=29522 RepID=UPI0026652097|nr:GNAT family N-acetyltransferase [Brachyspira aalborgi]
MFKIERAKINDIEEISDLVKRIYLKYNSKIDSEEGINNILTFISKENMQLRFYIEGALMLVARNKNNKIVGAIELKNFEHISLFFVDDKYFKFGIGKKLFEEVKNILKLEKYSVNASDYALEFYKKLGFIQITDSIKIEKGVHFYPMLY